MSEIRTRVLIVGGGMDCLSLAVALGPVVVPISSLVAHRLFPRAAPAGFIVAGTLVTAAGASLTMLAVLQDVDHESDLAAVSQLCDPASRFRIAVENIRK